MKVNKKAKEPPQRILRYNGYEVLIGGRSEEDLREASEAFLLFKKWVENLRKKKMNGDAP